jgi:hypothetical protein
VQDRLPRITVQDRSPDDVRESPVEANLASARDDTYHKGMTFHKGVTFWERKSLFGVSVTVHGRVWVRLHAPGLLLSNPSFRAEARRPTRTRRETLRASIGMSVPEEDLRPRPSRTPLGFRSADAR